MYVCITLDHQETKLTSLDLPHLRCALLLHVSSPLFYPFPSRPPDTFYHLFSLQLTQDRGNKVLIAIAVFNVSLILAAKAYYIWRNKVRERKWSGMNATEKEAYLDGFIGAGRGENGGEVALNGARGGNKRLDFRFVH